MSTNARVVFLGRSAGKTALLVRKVNGVFSEDNETVFMNEFIVPAEVGGRAVSLRVNDVSEDDGSLLMVDPYIGKSDVVVIFFSIATRWTFDAAGIYAQRASGKTCFLVGNMADREDERAVTREEAEAYAADQGMRYIETSAKTNQNVDELIAMIAEECCKNDQHDEPNRCTVF